MLARDGHRCVRCGATNKLTAHHIRPGNTPDCGITVCESCHKEIDPYAR